MVNNDNLLNVKSENSGIIEDNNKSLENINRPSSILKNENNLDILNQISFVDSKNLYNEKINIPSEKKIIERIGDWVCFNCKNLNFSFRISCNRCNLSKEESENLKILRLKNNQENNLTKPIFNSNNISNMKSINNKIEYKPNHNNHINQNNPISQNNQNHLLNLNQNKNVLNNMNNEFYKNSFNQNANLNPNLLLQTQFQNFLLLKQMLNMNHNSQFLNQFQTQSQGIGNNVNSGNCKSCNNKISDCNNLNHELLSGNCKNGNNNHKDVINTNFCNNSNNLIFNNTINLVNNQNVNNITKNNNDNNDNISDYNLNLNNHFDKKMESISNSNLKRLSKNKKREFNNSF